MNEFIIRFFYSFKVPLALLNDIHSFLFSDIRFVHIAVMDYYPITIYTKYPMFWPVIDDALRRAAIERGVEVKLLLSNWTSTRPQMKDYLKSLTDLSRYIVRGIIIIREQYIA